MKEGNILMIGKPTEEDVLMIKDLRDPYYSEAMEHANNICGWSMEEKQTKTQHNK